VPVVRSIVASNGTTAGTSQVVNIPSATEVGDLLIAALRGDAATNHSWPAPWTRLFFSTADASNDGYSVAWLFARASDVGGTVTVTATGSGKYAGNCASIMGASATRAPDTTSVAIGTSVNPDPPPITPASGVEDVLFVSVMSCEGEQSDAHTPPTNYTFFGNPGNSGTAGVVTTNCRIAMAFRNIKTGSSEDPGTWTISVSDDWMTTMMCVYPGRGPSPAELRRQRSRVRSWPQNQVASWARARSGLIVPAWTQGRVAA
jgi:hypothetical protein